MKIAFVSDYDTPPYYRDDLKTTTAHEPIPRVGEMVQEQHMLYRVLKIVYKYDLNTVFVYVKREIPE